MASRPKHVKGRAQDAARGGKRMKQVLDDRPIGVDAQPLSRVEWVPVDGLRANDWNPNATAGPELDLLAQSIMEDGWTQPLVVTSDGEIVDGFHRSFVATNYDGVRSMTDGLVPVVRLDKQVADRMLATVRHNRARGQHAVASMAEIVRTLMENHGYTESDLIERVGMEREEVIRLADHAGIPERVMREGIPELSRAWVPVASSDAGDDDAEGEDE